MSINLNKIAILLEGKLVGDPDCMITGIAPIEHAVVGQICFAEKESVLKRFADSKASAVIVPKKISNSSMNLVQVEQPRVAFTKMLEYFNPTPKPASGIHSTAVIGNNCTIGEDAYIAAGVVIGNNVKIADRVIIHPNAVIGDNAVLGEQSIIYPNASILERCIIGCRVIIHAGTVIGSDGFGFVFDKGRHLKIPQIGVVQIDDDVEIGANNTIDRATMGKTWIKTGVKTDNLVHIAHNVVIGEHSVITGQVGIAGSTTIGRNAVIAGQAGIGGHLTIGKEVTIGPQGAVAQSIGDKQIYSSTTLAMPHGTWLRLQKVLPKLPALSKKITKIEQQLSKIIGNKQKTP